MCTNGCPASSDGAVSARTVAEGTAQARDPRDHGRVPELPEVEALAAFLRASAVGRVLTPAARAAVRAIKPFAPPLSALGGLEITGAGRHGKFLDLDVSGVHLVVHL